MPDLMASGGNSGAHRRLMYARGNHLNCKRVNLEGRQEVATKQLEQFVLVALHGPYTVEQNFRRHLCASRTFWSFTNWSLAPVPTCTALVTNPACRAEGSGSENLRHELRLPAGWG